MGYISDIDTECMDGYVELVGKNVAENIERENYDAIVYCNDADEAEGAIVFRLCDVDSFGDVKSELVSFEAKDTQIANKMLSEYEGRIREEDVKVSFFELADLPDEIVRFFQENGFKVEKREGMDICVTLSDVTANRSLMPKKYPKDITPLSKLELLQFRQGITNCLFNGVSGLYDDLALLPKEWYDEDVSCAFMDGEAATGFFLVHALPDGVVMPVLLFAAGVDSKKNILNMLRYATFVAAQKYEKNSSIIVRRHDDRTRKLAKYLFPEAKGRVVNAGERQEG